jgi:hypothetical protein
MNATYEKQRHIFNSFVKKFLTPEQRNDLQLHPEDSIGSFIKEE